MDNIYHETTHKLRKASMLHRYRIFLALSGLKIYRGQPEILEYLATHGDCSQKELAASLGVSPASIATSLKRMDKENYIERTPDENDRRINRLKITEKGDKARLEGRARCNKVDEIMFSGFSAEEIEIFSSMLTRISDNLSGGEITDKEVLNFIINKGNGDDKND